MNERMCVMSMKNYSNAVFKGEKKNDSHALPPISININCVKQTRLFQLYNFMWWLKLTERVMEGSFYYLLLQTVYYRDLWVDINVYRTQIRYYTQITSKSNGKMSSNTGIGENGKHTNFSFRFNHKSQDTISNDETLDSNDCSYLSNDILITFFDSCLLISHYNVTIIVNAFICFGILFCVHSIKVFRFSEGKQWFLC